MEVQKPTGPYADPPPPYSHSPEEYTGGYQPKSSTVVIGPSSTRQVTVINMVQWGPYPMQMTCPYCAARIVTETVVSPGFLTWILSGTLVLLGCWLGCCLIPCCIPECQDVEHHCPNCKIYLGSYHLNTHNCGKKDERLFMMKQYWTT
ncbi:lipopolysaccharide-induced tumor necrosis factor-alpha factor homolog isoform X2 [Limulus polyphemus]|uniref:Lipopolysaccharide-induced tumor necrosis factor-alpha factor homolog isoform X2 n=1 Tax=Limulus polyphemus TaxID=6850 RepID=A0ABM1SSP0_LIMPO|nr:lipopolysaccharide-induced tumor necrosis factor-alpha factor homolog isoform X2 [Limulus polyphemus]